jgi:hypothetical protein
MHRTESVDVDPRPLGFRYYVHVVFLQNGVGEKNMKIYFKFLPALKICKFSGNILSVQNV